jgi:ankyrin repeat protein
MQRIRNQAPDLVEIAETVLFWVVCARRLFHIVELCHAYATLELAEGNSLEDDDLPDAELLVSTCCGLVRIDEESQLVRMVHYTAQEYFYKYHVPAIISAHLNLARICIAYILQPACSIPETEEFSGHVSSLVVATPPDFSALYEGLNESFLSHVRKYPFLDYACEHWASHINHASDSELDASWPDVMKLLSDKAGLAVASVVVDTLHPLFSGRTHPAPSRSYYLSRLDAPRVLWWLLASEADDINAKDGLHFTPLMRAACLGLTENVKVLLHFGADTRPRSYYDDSALTFAALSGVASCVKALVDAGVDLNRTRYDDRTALRIAVRQGHVDMVKILIEAGADLKCRDIFRMTATDHAAARRNVEVLKLLIQAGAALSVHDALWTPLHWAAFQGTPETIKVLLDAGADVNCEAGAYGLPFDSDFQSATPLMLAAENTRNPQVIEVLLEAGGNVHLRDITGLTALHYAAWEGTPTTARLLLDTGADLEAVDREHRTPLMYAIDHGNIEVVQLLMAAGANVHARDHAGATALHAAAMKGHPEVVRMLLNAGASADIDVVDSHWGTPLIDAARNNNTEVVKILIEAGANLYATNKFGETALHRALHRALKRDDSGVTLGSARTLIDAGFNVNIPTPHRPLSHCLQCDNPESLELLLDSGAELEYCDDILPTPGYTPLHYVAKCGKQRCARVLIKRGVNVNAVSEENKTPLSLALAHGHVEIAQMLIQAGADIHTVVEDSEMLSRTLAAGEVGAAQLLLDAGATLEGFEPEDLIELKAELSKTEQEGPFGRKERIKEVRSVLARLSFRHSLGLLGM